MFDPVGAFTKQFTPTEGGYLFYPSAKSGGKFIAAEEYDRLVADWHHITGRAGLWKAAGVFILALLCWTLLSSALSMPAWTDNLIIVVLVLAISIRSVWASLAPRRLVKNRPAIAPPRPVSDARRQARAMFNWPTIIFALLLSGTVFFSAVTATERSWGTWIWLIGSGLMLACYLWIGFHKLRDQRH